MKRSLILSAVISLVFLGAGCASNRSTSKDDLFIGGSASGDMTSNQGTSLQTITPTKITSH